MRRISYRTGFLFAAATIPGALLGSWLTHFIPKREFGLAFGFLLVAVARFLAITRSRRRRETGSPDSGGAGRVLRARVTDTVTTRDGQSHVLSYNRYLGAGLSFLVGCFTSLVGIGGGLIRVPLFSRTIASSWIVVGLALALAVVGVHLVLTALLG